MVLESLARPRCSRDTGEGPIPLHGGEYPVRTMLAKLKVACDVVEQQELPDGDFPTVSMPNTEDPQAMRLAIELGIGTKADIVLGTDPDADRLGIAIPSDSSKESYTLLTGNQIAVLLCDYLITTWAARKQEGGKQPLVVKSIVTTDLVKVIAESNGGACVDVLTGFNTSRRRSRSSRIRKSKVSLRMRESFGYLRSRTSGQGRVSSADRGRDDGLVQIPVAFAALSP